MPKSTCRIFLYRYVKLLENSDKTQLREPKSPTYPSNCLAFLNEQPIGSLDDASHIRLNIIVVGAGLGGLATAISLASSGHTVTVYEQACELGEV